MITKVYAEVWKSGREGGHAEAKEEGRMKMYPAVLADILPCKKTSPKTIMRITVMVMSMIKIIMMIMIIILRASSGYAHYYDYDRNVDNVNNSMEGTSFQPNSNNQGQRQR